MKDIKGYAAIFDSLDGSFDFICSAETEDECMRQRAGSGISILRFSV